MRRRWRVRLQVAAALGVIGGAGACGGPRHPVETRTEGLYGQRIRLEAAGAGVLRGRRIVLDPGHGGRFGGSEGAAKTREADVNLGVALYLWGLLHDAGANVVMTRSSDRDLLDPGQTAVRDDLAARVAQIDSFRPDVFLSLHHNSNPALDRERNAIETYYKLDDDGPSYDLGGAIQRRLAAALGIDVARLLPGNYFVLRGATSATGAAVLGEASYLSNPKVEAALQLAASQRLEAEAYFLGLVDYFSHGVAAIERATAASDTVALDAPVFFTAAFPLEPATITVQVDGVRVPVEVDGGGVSFAVLADWSPGLHAVEAQGRLVRGNAARAWRGRLLAYAPPAQAVLTALPASPGARTRVQARVLDALGRAVSDGVAVQWECKDAQLLAADSTVTGGAAIAWVRVTTARPQIAIRAGAAQDTLTIQSDARPGSRGVWRCVDARTGAAIDGAWSASARSDRNGLLELPADPVQVQRRGYARWRGMPPQDGVVRLDPLRAGAFLEIPLVVDPAGEGGEPALAGLGFAAGDAAFDLARMLAGTLEALGARPALARGAAGAVADLDRVRIAARTLAQWYIRIEIVPAGVASAAHYPGSEAGERAARALHDALAARGFAPRPVRTDARFILQQTPCPAVCVQFPAAAVSTLGGRRNAIAALTAGLHTVLDPGAAALPPLVGRVAAAPEGIAILDGADTAPLVGGIFRFEHVTPGAHTITLLDSTRVEIPVQATGSDTLRIGAGH